MKANRTISPYYLLKGLMLGVVYLTLAVYMVFFVPRTVPSKAELQTVRLGGDELVLSYNKDANTSYFTGTYGGIELRSVTLTLKAGLELYGTNEFFIQMKERPPYYELMIARAPTLFGERYSIYQLADDKEVLLSYEFSSGVMQRERNNFFYFGLAFLGIMGFILVKTLIRKIREKK